MGTLFKLAWRNVWRQKRRTTLLIVVVAYASLSTVFFWGMTDGQNESLITNQARFIQAPALITIPAYQNDPDPGNALPNLDFISKIESISGVDGAVPRLELFGLLRSAYTSENVMVRGVVPDLEASVSNIPKKLIDGRMLATKGEVILGEGLAERLDVRLGERVALDVSSLAGTQAAGLILVGVVDINVGDLDQTTVLIHIDDARRLTGVETATAVALDIARGKENNIAAKVSEVLFESYGQGTLMVFKNKGFFEKLLENTWFRSKQDAQENLASQSGPELETLQTNSENSVIFTPTKHFDASETSELPATYILSAKSPPADEDKLSFRNILRFKWPKPESHESNEAHFLFKEDVEGTSTGTINRDLIEDKVKTKPYLIARDDAIPFSDSKQLTFKVLENDTIPESAKELQIKLINSAAQKSDTAIRMSSIEAYGLSTLMGEMNKMLDANRVQMIPIGILFAIFAALAVTSTLFVSVLERSREFGMMGAIGISPPKLAIMVMLEAVIATLVGWLIGLIFGYSLTWLFSVKNIFGALFAATVETFADFGFGDEMYTANRLIYILYAAATIGFAAIFALLAPARKVANMTPAKAMRAE